VALVAQIDIKLRAELQQTLFIIERNVKWQGWMMSYLNLNRAYFQAQYCKKGHADYISKYTCIYTYTHWRESFLSLSFTQALSFRLRHWGSCLGPEILEHSAGHIIYSSLPWQPRCHDSCISAMTSALPASLPLHLYCLPLYNDIFTACLSPIYKMPQPSDADTSRNHPYLRSLLSLNLITPPHTILYGQIDDFRP